MFGSLASAGGSDARSIAGVQTDAVWGRWPPRGSDFSRVWVAFPAGAEV